MPKMQYIARQNDAKHAPAKKHCNKCNLALCLECAFTHVQHGTQDITVKLDSWKQKLKGKLDYLKEKQDLSFAHKLKMDYRDMQMVCVTMLLIVKGK